MARGAKALQIKKYFSWFQISRKLRGILYPYTDKETNQEIVDALFASLNKLPKKAKLSELSCQLCNDLNPVWYAPNEVWNLVAKDKYHFLCPNCFIRLAERKGIEPTGWKITPEFDSQPKPVSIGTESTIDSEVSEKAK